jgi:hypothetical protein
MQFIFLPAEKCTDILIGTHTAACQCVENTARSYILEDSRISALTLRHTAVMEKVKVNFALE